MWLCWRRDHLQHQLCKSRRWETGRKEATGAPIMEFAVHFFSSCFIALPRRAGLAALWGACGWVIFRVDNVVDLDRPQPSFRLFPAAIRSDRRLISPPLSSPPWSKSSSTTSCSQSQTPPKSSRVIITSHPGPCTRPTSQAQTPRKYTAS